MYLHNVGSGLPDKRASTSIMPNDSSASLHSRCAHMLPRLNSAILTGEPPSLAPAAAVPPLLGLLEGLGASGEDAVANSARRAPACRVAHDARLDRHCHGEGWQGPLHCIECLAVTTAVEVCGEPSLSNTLAHIPCCAWSLMRQCDG